MDYFFYIRSLMNSKKQKYQRIINQLSPLLERSPNLISQLSTINAVLYHKMQNIFWIGFYFKLGNSLQVGPYQGPLACQTLEYPKGVCWSSVINKKAIIVPNVELFPGHISCDSRSKSEIVIPIFNGNDEVLAILDIDSNKTEAFDETDQEGLENIIKLLNSNFTNNFQSL